VNARPLKVCFVLPSLAGGGAERVAVQVLNALDADRWHRSMFLFERAGPYLEDLSPSIALHVAPSRSRLGVWRALRRFVRRERPDVVVVFLSFVSVLTAVRAATTGCRVVFAVQTPLSAFLEDRDYRWSRPWNRVIFTMVMRICCRAADVVVAASRGVAADVLASFGGRPARVVVVNNPVDIASVVASSREPIDEADALRWRRPVVVAAGRLAEAKNYPLLIDAFAHLKQRVDASLFILGQGDQESVVRRLIAERNLGESVHLCGFRRNPWSYMARADVFALSSRYEGFGNVLVEAMACGVPVVATRSPGSEEVVTPDANGLLVEQHDPQAFAAALERLLCDAPLRQRMASAASETAARFRVDSIARAYEGVMTEALA
jgi:glycosyltransferase involved in cell wall biosynthesis